MSNRIVTPDQNSANPLPSLISVSIDACNCVQLATEVISDLTDYVDVLEMLLEKESDGRIHRLAVLAQEFGLRAIRIITEQHTEIMEQHKRIKAVSAQSEGAHHD